MKIKDNYKPIKRKRTGVKRGKPGEGKDKERKEGGKKEGKHIGSESVRRFSAKYKPSKMCLFFSPGKLKEKEPRWKDDTSAIISSRER